MAVSACEAQPGAREPLLDTISPTHRAVSRIQIGCNNGNDFTGVFYIVARAAGNMRNMPAPHGLTVLCSGLFQPEPYQKRVRLGFKGFTRRVHCTLVSCRFNEIDCSRPLIRPI